MPHDVDALLDSACLLTILSYDSVPTGTLSPSLSGNGAPAAAASDLAIAAASGPSFIWGHVNFTHAMCYVDSPSSLAVGQ
jgi:hypothetical protein